MIKQDGKLVEQVYRAGTPDGKVAAGMYAQSLKKANGFLARAQNYAEPDQARVIGDLIRYYQTGEFRDWLQFGGSWVKNNSPVDFVNGFIEVYRDARSAKGSSQAFGSITDEKKTARRGWLRTRSRALRRPSPGQSRPSSGPETFTLRRLVIICRTKMKSARRPDRRVFC